MDMKFLMSVALAATLGIYGCSDSDNGGGSGGTAGSGGSAGGGGTGGDAGGGGTGGTPKGCADIPDTTSYIVQGAPETTDADCVTTLSATGDNDQAQILQAILDLVGEERVLCLNAGVYDMGATINVTDRPGLTIKGIGASPDDVVLEYADGDGNCRGNQGINVTVPDVTIENLWVKNTCANAVVQRDTSGSVFRKVRVSWDGTPRTENGAYGVYPTDCSDTLVEYCQTQGASDAGVYIGKCDGGIVRNNVIYENVAGLEVENCLNVETYNNEIFDNTGGLLALQQDISAEMQSNSAIRLYDNEVYCNNRENFAQPGSAVAGIPVGTGGLSFVGNGIEFFNNQFTDNWTLGIALASNIVQCQAEQSDCPPYSEGYDPYTKNIYVHDNLYTNNGTDPQGLFGEIFMALGFGGEGEPPVPEVVWDGYQERICTPESDNPGAQCFGNILACSEGSDNPGEECSTDEDCPNGECVNTQCPNGSCVLEFTNVNEAGICLGNDATAAASVLVLGDLCGDLGLNILQVGACFNQENSTDQAPFLCEPQQQ